MKEKLLYLLLVLMIAVPVFAQNKNAADYAIKGQVVDSLSNESVPYATLSIALASAPQKAVKLLACDENGKFTGALKEPGKYIMSMQSLGKAPAQRSFTLSESKKSLDLGKLLMNDDTQNLKEVTVTAQKPLIKAEIDKITYNLEDDPESKTNNTLEMLRKVPMVTVDGEDKIQLKGSSNYKIYMNGKPSNLLSGGNASDVLKSMPASSVKNIEVITDPGAKYDAEGVGGIINIITTKNALQGYTGTVRANASSLGSLGAGGYLSAKVGKLGLTANYGYRNRNSPWNTYESTQENYLLDPENPADKRTTVLKGSGRNKYKGPFQYGYLEGSYEIDTLNLISVGVNLYNGNSKSLSETYSEKNMFPSRDLTGTPEFLYKYSSNSSSKRTFGSTDVNVDYQHSTQKKDELLTLSYRFSRTPNNSEGHNYLSDVVNFDRADEYPRWNINDASTNEHTAQVDYTTPTRKDQTLEVGVKYIFRQSKSNTLEQLLDSVSQQWEDITKDNSDFVHSQHIYSGYLGYALKFTKFGAKAGVRAEGTKLSAEYRRNETMNFSTDYFDVVPNLTLTYQINMAQQLRLGYNMRIQRPGIWYLNPYIDNVNPERISQGNPELDSEKSNNVNLNYSMFTQKFSLNASLNYTFVNNAIERYSFIADFDKEDPRSAYNGSYWSTYGNVGKRQQVGLYVYGNWNPVPLFRVYLNGGMNYVDLKSKAMKMENSGVSGNAYMGMQFNLPLDFRFYLNGGYYSPWISLQDKGSSFYFASASVSKDLLKKKLSLSLGFQNPFWKNMKYENTTTGENFRNHSINYNRSREVYFSVSYKFGTLKESIKKVRRGISNDDQKSGGSGGSGEGGGGNS